jgi:hypothetical protein
MKMSRFMRWVALSGTFTVGMSAALPALAHGVSQPSLGERSSAIRLCDGDEDGNGDEDDDTSIAQPLCGDDSDDGDDGDDGGDDDGDGDETSLL